MTDPSALTAENWIATIIAGLGIGLLGIWKYWKELTRPATTAANGDRIVPGITIADMQPIRDLAAEQARTTAANERIAKALEGLLELTRERAADEEIMRRAEIMAQQMVKQLPVANQRRPP